MNCFTVQSVSQTIWCQQMSRWGNHLHPLGVLGFRLAASSRKKYARMNSRMDILMPLDAIHQPKARMQHKSPQLQKCNLQWIILTRKNNEKYCLTSLTTWSSSGFLTVRLKNAGKSPDFTMAYVCTALHKRNMNTCGTIWILWGLYPVGETHKHINHRHNELGSRICQRNPLLMSTASRSAFMQSHGTKYQIFQDNPQPCTSAICWVWLLGSYAQNIPTNHQISTEHN